MQEMRLEPRDSPRLVEFLLREIRVSGDFNRGGWCSFCFLKCLSGHTQRMKS